MIKKGIFISKKKNNHLIYLTSSGGIRRRRSSSIAHKIFPAFSRSDGVKRCSRLRASCARDLS